MAAIVRLIVRGASLEEAVDQAIEIAACWRDSKETVPAILDALDPARSNNGSHEQPIRSLGQGCGADSAASGPIPSARVVAAVGAHRNCVAPAPIFFVAIVIGSLMPRSWRITLTGH